MTEREEFDISDMGEDEIVAKVVDELLKCEICRTKSDEVTELSRSITDTGLIITAEFDCDNCGAHNEPEAVLS